MSATVAAVFWGVLVRTLNGSNYSRTILLLCIAICFYIFGYTLELNSASQAQILFWNHVEYIGIPFVSALWLTTALLYTGHFIRHKNALLAAIYVIPIITLVLRFSNTDHHLYFASVSYVEKYGRLLLIKKAGPWFYVQLIHSMLMILVAMGLFVQESVTNQEKQKGKVLLTIAASAVAVTGLILSVAKPFGLSLDYMACCLPVTCVMLILAISRYDLLEAKSIGRNRAFEASGEAILLINRQNKVLDYNGSAKRLFEQLDVRMDNGYLATLFSRMPDLLDGLEKTEMSVVKLHVNGRKRYYDITTKNIDDRNILHGWIKTIRDVTEIYQLNEELKRQAMTDELSTLNNRRAFIQIGQERVLECDRTGSPLHLFMMDLDHFKDVNDQYGHPAGDVVIRDFGQILKFHFGADSLIARLGGEEFAVLHTGFSDPQVLQMSNSLLTKTAQYRYSYRSNQFHVTVSVGVTKKRPEQTLESMMRRADKALYLSKDRGRNCLTVL